MCYSNLSLIQRVTTKPVICILYLIINVLIAIAGILAIIFSSISCQASKHGDMEKASQYGRKACIVSTVALICGVIIIITAIAVSQAAAASTADSYNSNYYYYG